MADEEEAEEKEEESVSDRRFMESQVLVLMVFSCYLEFMVLNWEAVIYPIWP